MVRTRLQLCETVAAVRRDASLSHSPHVLLVTIGSGILNGYPTGTLRSLVKLQPILVSKSLWPPAKAETRPCRLNGTCRQFSLH